MLYTIRVCFLVALLSIYSGFMLVGCGGNDNGNNNRRDTTAPSIPANPDAQAISSSQINLSWTASSDNISVAGYRIYQSGNEIATSSTTSYADTGLDPDTPYTYTVTSYDTVGNESAQSSQVQATTFSSTSASTVEGLDELFNRKQRMATATYPANELEDAGNNYIWQPETVMYRDVTTGHEVWKMSNTPGFVNFYHNDIGVSPWSADGKRMAFVAGNRSTQAGYSGRIWMVVNTGGKNLRPTVEAADYGYSSINDYFHWNPQIPDLYYEVGYRGGTNPNELHQTTVTDTSVSHQLILAYPENIGIDKMISPDGRKILMGSYSEATVYPTTIYPSPSIDDPDGYSVDRDLALYGSTPNPYSTVHGRQYVGNGEWYYVMPVGGANRAWWRLKSIGSAADGGAYCNNSGFPVQPEDLPYDFGECWPEMAHDTPNRDPFGSDYWSHFVPDRWGRYALFSSVDSAYSDPLGPGPGVWNVQDHSYSVLTFGGSAQHHDWHGFTDWTVSSRGSGGTSYLDDRIYIQKYDDVSSQLTVNYTHTHYNGGGPSTYPSGTRLAQSPDGTKVAWQSEFLNSAADAPDIFWSVAYYPYSPTDLSATYSSGVKIAWLPPKYTERGWPYASSSPSKDALGWPLLDSNGNEIGEPLYAREIKRYHVWRSTSQNGAWQEVGSVDAQYSYTYAEDPNMFMLHPVAGGLKVETGNKISFTDNPGNGIFYYALTSEEHSGLESDELSEILQVTISGGSIINQSIIQAKGQKNFWASLPSSPTNFTATSQATAGHYRLTWTEPGDSTIRFYNLYYATSSSLPIDQATRIASFGVGTSTYLDWLANPDASNHYYAITAVDRHGNESSPVYVGGN